MKNLISLILLIGIVAISGCVGGPDIFRGIFGPSQPAVEQTPDLLIFSSAGIVPNPPISAGNDFTVWVELKNQAEPGTPDVKDVKFKIYDYGVCKSNSELEKSYDTFSAGQIERIENEFKAPSNNEIGFIEADCPIRYYVSYITSARSQDDFDIISKERLQELQRLGESPSWKDQPQYVGIGPVKIYFNWKTLGPVEENKTIQFSIQVVDKGNGVFDKVENRTLFLEVPVEWKNETGNALIQDGKVCNNKFRILETGDIFAKLTINQDIKLINKQTPEIVCTFKAPEIEEPEKSYIIKAYIDNYEYKLYG
ncbi:MAG: hypothetical protein QXY29_00950, partial [Candidatus Aenigmatarchaeota archaeon]